MEGPSKGMKGTIKMRSSKRRKGEQVQTKQQQEKRRIEVKEKEKESVAKI